MNPYLGYTLLAFGFGLVSTLFVQTPVGIIAMLDMAAYVLAIPMFVSQYRSYPKHFRRLLLLAVLWIINAIITDMYRGTPFNVAFKAEMILVDAVCLAIVGAWTISRSPTAFMWFISAVSISTVISLYKFQNGALLSSAMQAGFSEGGDMAEYLADKQVLPLWMDMIIMAGVFSARMFLRLPWPICIASFFAGGFYLLVNGGSRSVFLTMTCAGFLTILYVYAPKVLKTIFAHKVIVLFGVVVAALAFNAAYLYMAREGVLGEAGYKKLDEKAAGASGFLDDRSDIIANWPFLWRNPIIGAGTLMVDKWGYMQISGFGRAAEKSKVYREDRFLGHSCIVGAWTANGIMGLVFWAYVLWLIFDFIGDKIFVLGDRGPFFLNCAMIMVWNILFSPFGMYRAKAMFLAAFLAYVQDFDFIAWVRCEGLSVREKMKYFNVRR